MSTKVMCAVCLKIWREAVSELVVIGGRFDIAPLTVAPTSTTIVPRVDLPIQSRSLLGRHVGIQLQEGHYEDVRWRRRRRSGLPPSSGRLATEFRRVVSHKMVTSSYLVGVSSSPSSWSNTKMMGGSRSLARVSVPWTYPDASFVQHSPV